MLGSTRFAEGYIVYRKFLFSLFIIVQTCILTLIACFRGAKSDVMSSSFAEYSEGVTDVTQPAPPDMFANHEAEANEDYVAVDETYEDENGDPYSIV